MSGNSIGETIKQFFWNILYRVVKHREDQVYEEGRHDQANEDIVNAVCSYLEMGKKPAEICDLLKKHFGVDSVTDAEKYIHGAKLRNAKKSIQNLVLNEGKPSRECDRYWRKLEEKIKSDPEILNLTPEKLKKELDKE